MSDVEVVEVDVIPSGDAIEIAYDLIAAAWDDADVVTASLERTLSSTERTGQVLMALACAARLAVEFAPGADRDVAQVIAAVRAAQVLGYAGVVAEAAGGR